MLKIAAIEDSSCPVCDGKLLVNHIYSDSMEFPYYCPKCKIEVWEGEL